MTGEPPQSGHAGPLPATPGRPATPSAPPGDVAAFYEAGYATEDPARAALYGRWRALGARGKADHVVTLCGRAGLRPATVVELGCGDGALLAALAARGLAGRLDGFELSGHAAAIARDRRIPGTVRVERFDGARVPAADGAYDLAVLSHVLEHVPDPGPLLAEAARLAPHVLVEVPLEANRSAARPAKRALARDAGHLHAFDRAAVTRSAPPPACASAPSSPIRSRTPTTPSSRPPARSGPGPRSSGRCGPRCGALHPGAPSAPSPSTTPAWLEGSDDVTGRRLIATRPAAAVPSAPASGATATSPSGAFRRA